MRVSKKHSAMQIDAPSLLVGEGIAAGQRKLGGVRGSISDLPMRRQPIAGESYH
jgi:hypothetical protein